MLSQEPRATGDLPLPGPYSDGDEEREKREADIESVNANAQGWFGLFCFSAAVGLSVGRRILSKKLQPKFKSFSDGSKGTVFTWCNINLVGGKLLLSMGLICAAAISLPFALYYFSAVSMPFLP